MIQKIRNHLSRNRGFTLVEIILAMAVLAVVILAYTMLFTDSFRGIFTAGHKTRALYEAQQEVEQKMNEGTTQEQVIQIAFPSKTISVKGEEVQVEYEYLDHQGNITVFVPE